MLEIDHAHFSAVWFYLYCVVCASYLRKQHLSIAICV
jgi:hypothetical protein